MTTSVPPVTIGPRGPVLPTDAAILSGVLADNDAAFGGGLNPALSTPQGQLATSEAAIISQADQTFVEIMTQVDPAFAQGRMQDAIGRIYFIERNPALPTSIQVDCVGAQGVVIPSGSLVQDTSGNVYSSAQDATVPAGGTVQVQFDNLVPGPVAIPATVSIYRAIPGWDTAAVASGSLGAVVESRAAFEDRRAASVAGNSFGSIGAIVGSVAAVPDVLDYWGYDNGTAAPVTVLGVSVPAHAVWITAVGGTDLAVATAIWRKKAPGANYGGNTTVTVTDPNPLFAAPPAYSVTFERPPGLEVLFGVDLVTGPAVPADAATQVQAAIIAAFAGADGGPRARVAGLILATRFIAPVQALGAWAVNAVRSIRLGSINAPDVTFTGAIAGTTLTTSGPSGGAIAIGQYVGDATGHVAPGTQITAGAGTSWTVSVSQTVASETMYGILIDETQVQVNGNQAPEAVAGNIIVTVD